MRFSIQNVFKISQLFFRSNPKADLVRTKMLFPQRHMSPVSQMILKAQIKERLRKTRRVRHKIRLQYFRVNGEYTFVYR